MREDAEVQLKLGCREGEGEEDQEADTHEEREEREKTMSDAGSR